MESLEERRLFAVTTGTIIDATGAGGVIYGVAAIGDSQTDEYATHDILRNRSRGWVEILADRRRLNVGSWNSGDRGTPRHAGYAYDWARDGATTTDMLTEGQDAGVVMQVGKGRVSAAMIFIGLNDIAAITSAKNPVSAALNFSSKAINNIKTAVNRILASNPNMKVVIATLPDVTYMPTVRAMMGSGALNGVAVQFLRSIQGNLNNQIRALGKNSRVAIAEVAGLFDRMNANPTFQVGDMTMTRYSAGIVPKNMYVLDGIHFNTVTQGLIANEFILAMDFKFAANLRPIGMQELVDYARNIYRSTAPAAAAVPAASPTSVKPPAVPGNLFSQTKINISDNTLKKYLSPLFGLPH